MRCTARCPSGDGTRSPSRAASPPVGGVGLALMLILLLDGLWTGIESSVTTYEDHVGADLYVAQPGARNFIGAVRGSRADTVDEVRADPDVDWAAPVRTFLSIVGLHDRKVPVSIIGCTPGEPGGPWEITDGREPPSDDEVVVGQVMADQHGVGVGDSLELLGRGSRSSEPPPTRSWCRSSS